MHECAGEVPSWALATVKAGHVLALLDTAAAAAGPLPAAATGAKAGLVKGAEAAGPLLSAGRDTEGPADAANGDKALARAAPDAAGAPSPRDEDPVGFGAAAVAPGHAAEAPAAALAEQPSAELPERGGGGAQMGGELGAGVGFSEGFARAGAIAEPPPPGEPVTLAGSGFGGFVHPGSGALHGMDEAMRSSGAEGMLSSDAMDLG